jgi:hypothetical protein
MTLRRHGIVKGAGIRNDPVSASHHFVLRRAQDDGRDRIFEPQPMRALSSLQVFLAIYID